MTTTPAAIEADGLMSNLWEAIGWHAAQAAKHGDMAPSNKLLEAMDAVKKALASAAQPAAIGADVLPDALRVPLDSLHADADYLASRALSGSLTKEQLVGTIRERIDAAKAALASAAQPQADERKAFEACFSKPPFEWEFHRYGEHSAWPGNYQIYDHQCAWEGWKARAERTLVAAPKAEPPKPPISLSEFIRLPEEAKRMYYEKAMEKAADEQRRVIGAAEAKKVAPREPLTQEQANRIFADLWGGISPPELTSLEMKFVRAIEAAHGITARKEQG